MINSKMYVPINLYQENGLFSLQEIECFDIALIHDTRTGPQVILPQVK
jgi:hypothetical protein